MKAFCRIIIIMIVGLIYYPANVLAQWAGEKVLPVNFSVPPIALLDIEPGINNSIYFSISPTSESGASPEIANVTNQTLWLNYSSAIESTQGPRSINAQITGGSLPEGITLNVLASEYQGSGAGELGQPVGQVSLSEQSQTIITGVGNCYTGDGENNGHSLTFSIDVSDFSNLASTSASAITIIYTISDN